MSWHRNIQLARVGIKWQTRKVSFESHCNFLLLDRGVAMQQKHYLLTLSRGTQADTTNYFVVWWVLFECSSFDYRKWCNKRPGRLSNFRGSRGEGAFNRYEAFITEGRLFQFNWNVTDILSQEIKKIKERYPYFELDIKQDAVRKPLLVKHEES